MTSNPNYYSNPAFCQQSEFYNAQKQQRALSPQRNPRQSPVGAQTPLHILDTSISEPKRVVDEDGYEEQEFYEEMLVDDSGIIKQKKVVVVAQNNEGRKYIQTGHESRRQGSRYESIPPQDNRYKPTSSMDYYKKQKLEYEYIPMETVDRKLPIPQNKQHVQDSHMKHRYAVIDAEQETDLSTRNGRYALVPVEELTTVVSAQFRNRYEYIQDSPPKPPNTNRGDYIRTPQKPNQHRYEYIQQSPQRPVDLPPPPPRQINAATQKLHELLSTPKKPSAKKVQHPLSPQSLRKVVPPALSPISKTPQKSIPPKAQQKLNYALSTRQLTQEKRHTAIVAPMCSSPVQSVYSETTFSKNESWMNLSGRKAPVQATMAMAAIMMLLCGGVTTGLCFYMISILGRLYYLDFSIVAGFTCFIMGLLGYRARNYYWLPNRNYISGYIVLSVFSLLTCAGLLVLLVMRPVPGSPLADMTSGGVCGISVLSLMLSTTGVVASYCCKVPPPDNRVQHCAEGFTV